MILYRKIKRKIISKAYKFFTPINKLIFYLNGIGVGNSFRCNGVISIYNVRGKVKIGNHVRINSTSWANPIGFDNKTQFQIFDGAILEIGNYVGISNSSITCSKSVSIGNNVLIGAGTKIYDTDFHPLLSEFRYGISEDTTKTKTKSVIVDDGAFIGAGTIILKGSKIGKNCIVGAGSVVSGNIPDNEIWAGNPVRFIRKI